MSRNTSAESGAKLDRLVGKTAGPVVFEIDRYSCRLFARALGYTDEIYFDAEAAKAKGYRDIPAPVGFLGHPAFNPNAPAEGSLRIDIDSPYKRILNGGTDIEYFEDVCAGDRLTGTTRIVDVKTKEGAMGPMILLTIEESYEREARPVAKLVRTRILY
jgi:hypothetical protein